MPLNQAFFFYLRIKPGNITLFVSVYFIFNLFYFKKNIYISLPKEKNSQVKLRGIKGVLLVAEK